MSNKTWNTGLGCVKAIRPRVEQRMPHTQASEDQPMPSSLPGCTLGHAIFPVFIAFAAALA